MVVSGNNGTGGRLRTGRWVLRLDWSKLVSRLSFIHSCGEYLLSVYWGPGTVLSAGDPRMAVDKFVELMSCWLDGGEKGRKVMES